MCMCMCERKREGAGAGVTSMSVRARMMRDGGEVDSLKGQAVQRGPRPGRRPLGAGGPLSLWPGALVEEKDRSSITGLLPQFPLRTIPDPSPSGAAASAAPGCWAVELDGWVRGGLWSAVHHLLPSVSWKV